MLGAGLKDGLPVVYSESLENTGPVTVSPDCHSTPVHGLPLVPGRTAQKYLQLLAVFAAPDSWNGSDS